VSGNTRSRRLRRRGGSFGMGCSGTTRNGYISHWAIGARFNTGPNNQLRWLDCRGALHRNRSMPTRSSVAPCSSAKHQSITDETHSQHSHPTCVGYPMPQ
jgi:hypothetical protein